MGGGGRRAGEGDRENMGQLGGGAGDGGERGVERGCAEDERGMKVRGVLFKCGKWGEKKMKKQRRVIRRRRFKARWEIIGVGG